MDPQLLALLPDAAKLGILRHLSSGRQPAAPPPSTRQQQQQQAQQQEREREQVCRQPLEVPPAVVRRTLEEGLAIIDGFLERAQVEAARHEAQDLLRQRARAAGMVAATPGQQWASSAARGDQAAWLQGPAALEAEGRPALAAAVRRLAALQPWLAAQGHDVSSRPSFQLACYPGGGARYVRHRDASASVPYRAMTAILYLNPGWAPEHGGALCIYNHSTNGSDPCAASAADLRLAGVAQNGTAGGTQDTAAQAAGSSTQEQTRGCSDGLMAAGQPPPQPPQPPPQQQQPGQAEVLGGLDEGHPATVVPPIGGRLVVADSRLLHEVLPTHAERYAISVWFSRTPPAAAEVAAAAAAADAAPAEAEDAGKQQQQQSQAPPSAATASPATSPIAGAKAGTTAKAAAEPAAGAAAAAIGKVSCTLDASGITAPGCIFVSVPAYRDSEAQWTLADLFAKAAHPERVRVGVVWQVELPADAAIMQLAGDQRWLPQVRQVVLPAGEATGPCKARALAQQLWDGEEFYLQIDSHMRFVDGWDVKLLRMLSQTEAATGHSRAVLSTYPPGYEGEGPDALLPAAPLPTVLCAEGWGADGLLRIRGRKLKEALVAPQPALFWAAGLSFSRAQLIQEAPYPRHLPWLFFGEELLQLLHMWRAGWDIYTPSEAVAFHRWSRSHRPTFQAEHRPEERHAEERRRSQQAVCAALAGHGQEGAESENCNGSSGSGSLACGGDGSTRSRSLAAFWEHTGVNFRERSISARAQQGGLPPESFLSLAEPWDYC